MRRSLLTSCLLLATQFPAGCYPAPTAEVALGECDSLVLPPDGERDPDGFFEIYDRGFLLSGAANTASADPDAFPQKFEIEGPSVARLIVTRADGEVSIDLSVPSGTRLELVDEQSVVRCSIHDHGSEPDVR